MENLNQENLSQPLMTTKDQVLPRNSKSKSNVKNSQPSFSKKKVVTVHNKHIVFKTTVIEHQNGLTQSFSSEDFIISLEGLDEDTYRIVKRLVSGISAFGSKDTKQLITKSETSSGELVVLDELIKNIISKSNNKLVKEPEVPNGPTAN